MNIPAIGLHLMTAKPHLINTKGWLTFHCNITYSDGCVFTAILGWSCVVKKEK